jgi:SAM-dependent methyltransferase
MHTWRMREAGCVGAKTSEPWEHGERGGFKGRFDEDAAAYDSVRPVAPDVVFDEVVRLAGLRPGSSVLEIGPGTGQATRPLAERRLRVLALELGPNLARRARLNLARWPDVTVLTTSFETWNPEEAGFDAVFAANSFHWLDPDVRFIKSAMVLGPRGSLVVLSTPVVVPEGASRFWWELQDDWAAVGADRVDPATKHPDLVADVGPAMRASGFFHEPAVFRHRFDVAMTAEEYVTNLSTQTAVKALAPDAREVLLGLVRRRIEAGGGTLTVHHLAVLTVATRFR